MVLKPLPRRTLIGCSLIIFLFGGFLSQGNSQPEQYVEVRINDFEFHATQMPLQLHAVKSAKVTALSAK